MAFRPQIGPLPVILNGDMSSASLTSLPTIIQKISMLSYSYSWVGSSPVGSVSIQVSNDYSLDSNGKTLNTGTWNTITFQSAGSAVTSIAVSGNADNGGIDVFQTGFYAIRTVYARVSGTGTLQALLNGKVS